MTRTAKSAQVTRRDNAATAENEVRLTRRAAYAHIAVAQAAADAAVVAYDARPVNETIEDDDDWLQAMLGDDDDDGLWDAMDAARTALAEAKAAHVAAAAAHDAAAVALDRAADAILRDRRARFLTYVAPYLDED